MRIVGGAWRGRTLVAPPGETTRPTADRVRQALFDMLLHNQWDGVGGGRAWLQEARVLDGFAGTGALGLEALSRGAASAVFIERDRAALAALHANIAACRAADRCTVLAGDVLRPPPGSACRLAFLDAPYRQGLLPGAVAALRQAGWFDDGTLLVAELAAGEPLPALGALLADRAFGAARLTVWRADGAAEKP